MKRILFVLLFFCLLLTGCLSQEAQSCKDLIDQIGPVTLDSKQVIVDAEKAYANLSKEDQEAIESSYKKLQGYRKEYNVLEKTSAFEEQVDKIQDVTLDSKTLIDKAYELYNEIPSDEVNRVVESKNKLDEIKKEYESLLAADLVKKIDKLGTITLKSKTQIDELSNLYSKLSSEGKKLVTNIDVLDKAKTTYANLEKEAREARKKELLGKHRKEVDEVEGITLYLHDTFPEYIDVRCYLLPYIGTVESPYGESAIYVRYNYTEDSWVFFENVTISVDGNNYYKSFSYNDATRDNDYGVVWEYVDDIYTTGNQDELDKEIAMLKAISNSKKTIVRFSGDKYYYDFTVSKADKKAIKETLELFELIK